MSPPLWALVFVLACGLLAWLAGPKAPGLIALFWGPGIAAVVDIVAILGHTRDQCAATSLFLVNCWAIRLTAHLWARSADRRDTASQRRSLMQVLLQVILIWFIPAPLVAAMLTGGPLTALDYAGIGLAAAGFAFESLADLQLARFRADPAHANAVLERGLWRLSRHPNYFGEAMMWWGFFLIGFSAAHAWWLMLSPLLVTGLMLSGASDMEKTIAMRRPGYDAYRRRAGMFIPFPRKPWRRRHSPPSR